MPKVFILQTLRNKLDGAGSSEHGFLLKLAPRLVFRGSTGQPHRHKISRTRAAVCVNTIDHKQTTSKDGSTDICPAAIHTVRHAPGLAASVPDAYARDTSGWMQRWI